MTLKIIVTIILFIALIALIFKACTSVKYEIIVLCGNCAALVGMLFGLALGSIFFNI